MALYHFHVGQVKRSAGSSAVASAAYRAGEKLHSERYDEINDYTRKGEVLFTDILLPPQAPQGYADRETLWNAVERAEKRADAQLAYSFDIALQAEFNTEENMAMVRQFLEENFVPRGMVVDYAVHDPDKGQGGIQNPHFHVMCPMRPINPDGTWGNKQKKVPLLNADGAKIWDEKQKRWKFTAVPTTDWGSPETLETWRRNWCELCNAKFKEKGLETRIDWRSYERQGIDQLAQVHEGPAVRAMEEKGIRTEKGDYNRWVKSSNALLKNLKEKIAGLLKWIGPAEEELNKPDSPQLIDILMDYMQMQRTGAEKFSGFARKKANITTLKDVAEAVAYLQENEITSLEQLEKKLNSLGNNVELLNDSMKKKSSRMKVLKEAISQVSVYQENLPIFLEMGNKKYRFNKAREKYKAEHEVPLKLFYRARRILKEAGMPAEFSSEVVTGWQRELAELQKDYEEEYARLKPLREEQKKMSHIQYCVNRVIKTDQRIQQEQNTHTTER